MRYRDTVGNAGRIPVFLIRIPDIQVHYQAAPDTWTETGTPDVQIRRIVRRIGKLPFPGFLVRPDVKNIKKKTIHVTLKI